jgi:hypothetical protein
MKRLSVVIGLAVSALLASACGPGIAGSGNVVDETRSVPAYSTMHVEDGLAVAFTIGPRSVLVHCDDNLLPYVETFVRGDALVVRSRPNVQLFSSHILVVASNPTLLGLDASGGSTVTASLAPVTSFTLDASGGSQVVLDEVSAGDFAGDVSGGSQVTATGAASIGTLNVSGGSWMHGRALAVQNAELDVSGGSHLELTVLTHVDGSVSGGSHATIYGNPGGHLDSTGGSAVVWAGD